MITTPALLTPKKWPGFLERAYADGFASVVNMRKYDGTFIESYEPGDQEDKSLSTYRRKLHNLLCTYAKELGIPILFESPVVEYFESSESGGVLLQNGQKITADVVVAADGVGSKSRAIIDGNRDAPISSGFIMYRISYPADVAMKNPIIEKEWAGAQDLGFLYIGPGAHFIVSRSKNDFCWLLTCKVLFSLTFRLHR
jgi:2-polyprenyl-6-methoxyphenol hydroxylase-like FAD-dependent oxidoreductase